MYRHPYQIKTVTSFKSRNNLQSNNKISEAKLHTAKQILNERNKQKKSQTG